jgi:hypothetical protein
LEGKAVDLWTSDTGWNQWTYTWTATNKATEYVDSDDQSWSSTNITESFGEVTDLPDKSLREYGWLGGSGGVGSYPPDFVHHYEAKGVKHEWSYGDGSTLKATIAARTRMKLYTGGKAGVKRKSLVHLTARAEEYGKAPEGPWLHSPVTPVNATRIQVLGWWLFGREHFDAHGDLYLALPDNAVKDLNLKVTGAKHYGAWASATRHKLVHETRYPALTDTNLARLQLGVGEYVDCRFEPGDFPTNAVWTVTAGGVNTSVGNAVEYTAPSNAANATVTVDVAGTAKFKIKFNVKEPTGVDHAMIVSTVTNNFGPGVAAAGMVLDVYVAPTSVSFYRVEMGELPGPASGVWGYYTNFPATNLYHSTAGHFWPLTANNSWVDQAWRYEDGSVPFSAGSYTWVIPARWKIEAGITNEMDGWTQEVEMDLAGSISITKFDQTVIRTTNNVTTPSL